MDCQARTAESIIDPDEEILSKATDPAVALRHD
jgi:hypothetical protein